MNGPLRWVQMRGTSLPASNIVMFESKHSVTAHKASSAPRTGCETCDTAPEAVVDNIVHEKSKNLGIVSQFNAINLGGPGRNLVTLRLLKAKPLKATRIRNLVHVVTVFARSEVHRTRKEYLTLILAHIISYNKSAKSQRQSYQVFNCGNPASQGSLRVMSPNSNPRPLRMGECRRER